MANKGKRMLFEDEYRYLDKVIETYPDPTDIGGGGGDVNIEAGTGITITTESDDTKKISVDTETVAMKTDIPTEYSFGYGLSTTGSTVSIDTSVVPTIANNNSFTGTNSFTTLQVGAPKANFGLVSTQNSTADDYRRGLITFQDYNVHQAQLKLSTKDTLATQLNSWYAPIELNTGSDMDISFKRTNGDSYKLPSKTAATYTIATTDDIPTVPTTATSTSTVTPSTIQLTFTYTDDTTETVTLMTGASVSTTTTLS